MIKVLAYADAGKRTGFERVMRGVMDHLHGTGNFSIVVMGLGYQGNPEMPYDFPVYPAGDPGDPFGVLSMPDTIKKHKPDVVWMVQDLWNITTYMAHKPPELPAVCYFPVDTPNLKWSYGIAAGAMTVPVAYTQFGAQEAAAAVRDCVDRLLEGAVKNGADLEAMRTALRMPHKDGVQMHARLDWLAERQNPEAWQIIPHGLDRKRFEQRDRKACRVAFDIPADAFVVLNVNTNQFRKRLDLTMRVFADLARVRPDARLVLHCANSSERGWDLEQLARYIGIKDRIHLIHETNPEMTEDELVSLYNTADVMINTAGGEGWGLTAFEGAACGIPQMVPDWSATRELWANYGILLPVSDWRCEPKYLNSAHAIIDVAQSGALLRQVAADDDLRKEMVGMALANADRQPSWSEVGMRFEQLLTSALVERPLKELSLRAVQATRQGNLQSELQGMISL